MTMYGINDNDIMDEVLVSDMIHADKVVSEFGFGKDSWLEDSLGGSGSYSSMVSELLDRDFY